MADDNTLYFLTEERKTKEDYEFVKQGKAGNPELWEWNYLLSHRRKADAEFISRLEAGDASVLQEVEDEARKAGLRGTIYVKKNTGGLGRRGKFETKEHWRGKRQAGLRTIAKLKIDD